jgi:hypothetical protein
MQIFVHRRVCMHAGRCAPKPCVQNQPFLLSSHHIWQGFYLVFCLYHKTFIAIVSDTHGARQQPCTPRTIVPGRCVKRF